MAFVTIPIRNFIRLLQLLFPVPEAASVFAYPPYLPSPKGIVQLADAMNLPCHLFSMPDKGFQSDTELFRQLYGEDLLLDLVLVQPYVSAATRVAYLVNEKSMGYFLDIKYEQLCRETLWQDRDSIFSQIDCIFIG